MSAIITINNNNFTNCNNSVNVPKISEKNNKTSFIWNYPKKTVLPKKKFRLRNSLFTDLLEDANIRVVYHAFLALLFGLFVNSVFKYILTNDSSNFLGLHFIYLGFGKFHIALITWPILFLSTCLLYYIFKFWIYLRCFLHEKSANLRLSWDIFSATFLLLFLIGNLFVEVFIVLLFNVPPATASIVVFECTRFMMKFYAFVRSNLPKNNLTYTENSQNYPKFSKYLYFLFVPTLVYHADYPRTEKIRWYFVAEKATEVVAIIFFHSFLVELFFHPAFSDFGLRPFTWPEIILKIFQNALAGILVAISTFYLLLHSWFNLFAELLRFGDRQFYRDWWTATTAPEFFEKWNLVINNWLYMYLYRDLYKFVPFLSTTTAKFGVYLFSAVLHEMHLLAVFGFFLPALLIEYVILAFVICCSFLSKRNIPRFLFGYCVAFGLGHLMSAYSMEFYLRINTNYTLFNGDNLFSNVLVPKLLNTTLYIYN